MIQYLALTVGGQTLTAPQSLPQPGTGATIINNGLTLFISAGIVITVVVLIWAGIMWITSAGDKQKLASARARLTWAIIGLIIILVSFAIIGFISTVFSVQLLNFSF